MELRQLQHHELSAIWTIDRSEEHHFIYRLHGQVLERVPAFFFIRGWPDEQIKHDTPLLQACFDRGGGFFGMFAETQLVGIAVVDTLPLGLNGKLRQLTYLYVSRAHRGKGLGHRLFAQAQAAARSQAAQALYISATPTENTVNFYRACGAVLANPPDPALYALEPEDIHMVCLVESYREQRYQAML